MSGDYREREREREREKKKISRTVVHDFDNVIYLYESDRHVIRSRPD